MRRDFVTMLQCPDCGGQLALESRRQDGGHVREGALRSSCGRVFPVIAGVPRILPESLMATLPGEHATFFEQHPDLDPGGESRGSVSLRTQRAFGDEWHRFPEILAVHEQIFRWYFEGPDEIQWEGLRVLDAGCGMGRWLHFARRTGAHVVGMDVSSAIDVAAARDGEGADFVQADLRWPPFAQSSFDLVYSFGVLHHLEDPVRGVKSLATLVRPGGTMRLYVYRILQDESLARRALLRVVTLLRSVTTRLPYGVVHGVAWCIAAIASVCFLIPRRVLRSWTWGERLTATLPLVHYADVPFRMLVAEQFDRLCAPIEGRYRRADLEGWFETIGFQVAAILPGLGWRAIGRRPT